MDSRDASIWQERSRIRYAEQKLDLLIAASFPYMDAAERSEIIKSIVDDTKSEEQLQREAVVAEFARNRAELAAVVPRRKLRR